MRTLNKKVLAAAVSTCLAVGSVATPTVAVFAKNINRTAATSISLADGSYSVDITILKENTDSASAAAGYFTTKDLSLVVKNGSATLRLRYSNPMIGGLAQVIDGTKETLPVLKEGNDNYVELTFNELGEAANLYMEINTNSIFGIMKQTARVLLDESTLKKDGVTVTPAPEVTQAPTVTPSPTPTVVPTETPKEEGTIKDGVYETNVYLWHASNDQASMAASALNGTARILVKNGTGTIYIYTKQMTMGTITAYLQELKVKTSAGTFKDAKVEKKDAAGNPTCFSFTLPSFEEYVTIKVNPHVALMGNQDIDARLKVDYKTLKAVKEDNLTEAPEETKAPTVSQTAKPTPTIKPTAKPSAPSSTEKPKTETEESDTSNESTTAPSGTTGSTGTTWNDTEDTSEEEVTDEESEEESEEAQTEEEAKETEEAEEALPQTGEVTEQENASVMKKAEVETEDNTWLIAAAAACAASFLTSLLWTITIRVKKQ